MECLGSTVAVGMGIAREIRAELEGAGGSRNVTVRWLRDRFGYSRLTHRAITEIAQMLASEGIRATPPLPGAQLDDEVQLEIAGARGGVLRRTLRGGLKVWQVLVGLLGLAATITALISFTQESLPHPSHAPPPLHGDLNILVADFAAENSGAGSTRSREGDDVALSLYHSLDTRLHLQPRQPGNEEPLDIAIRGPSQTGAVTGQTAAERARALAKLAKTSNADVVVYGNLQVSASQTIFLPQFYVAPGELTGAEELAGEYDFGSAIRAPGEIGANPEASRILRQQIVTRTRALAEFILALNDLSAGSYSTAAQRLQKVLASPGWAEAPVVYLFLGNADLRLGRFQQAQDAYQAALRLEPDYARAQFGLAELQFQRACGGGGFPDPAGLARAITSYRRVLGARPQADEVALRLKTDLGIGKTYLCFPRPRCPLAQAQFNAAIRVDPSGTTDLAGDKAEAWGGLGVALELCPSDQFTTRRSRLLAVAARYRHAAQLATLGARQAYYWSALGRILADLHDWNSAISAYDDAIQAEPNAGLRKQYLAARDKLVGRQSGRQHG